MIAAAIFDWAQKTPDKPAVIHNGRPYSYAAFARLIAIARGFFARRGVTGEGIAVLAVRNLLEFWILSLALRSLGLTTVVVGKASAIDAIGLSGVRCVVVGRGELWPGFKALCAERGWPLHRVWLDGEAALPFDAAQVCGAHVLLTSGTTGTHKMVAITPGIEAHSMRQRVDLVGMNRDTVMCIFDFPPWTGIGYKWAASPWLVGGACMIEQSELVHAALLRPGITHAGLGPAKLDALLAPPEGTFHRHADMQLIVGGGALTDAQMAGARTRIAPRLFGLLSSTEAGAIALTALDTSDDRRWHRIVPGCVVEIVDEDDRPVAAGMTGRLRIATAGGAKSYFQNDEATRAVFRDGFFYPGDLAVMREDGRMALMGRVNAVLNVCGNKIPAAPLEDRLAEALRVSALCLFSLPEESGETILHAAIESHLSIDAERVLEKLPSEVNAFEHLRVVCLDTFPRNAMGKVLRQEVQAQAIAKDATLIEIGRR